MNKYISFILLTILFLLSMSCASKRKLKATEETKTEVIQERKEDKQTAIRDSSFTDVNEDVTIVQVTETADTLGRVLTKTTTTTKKKTRASKKTGADFTEVKKIEEEKKGTQKTETTIKEEKKNKEGRIFIEVIIFIIIMLILLAISIRQLIKFQSGR